jgi:ZIP family zinc transporter
VKEALLLSWLAGCAIPIGGLLASREHIQRCWLEAELRHTVIAFGGGALVAAVALVLVPEGLALVSTPVAAISFAAGGVLFFYLERTLARHGGERPQLAGMLLDFAPEACALGAAFATRADYGALLAFIIGVQNLPEGFNAFREMRTAGASTVTVLASFAALSLLGPVCAYFGYSVLGQHPVWLGSIMLLASGGILYLIFQDIAPQSKLERHWAPPLGAVGGFLAGMIGYALVHGRSS